MSAIPQILSKVTVFFLICLLSSFGAYAQQTDSMAYYFDLPLDELLQLKVRTTNKTNEYLTETPTSVNILTEKEIELLNFNTLEEVLEYIGLSSINGEGNFFTTTTIRGNTQVNYNTNTLLLIDGIPLTNGYHGSFDLQAIPISSIERLEIVKGSNSVLYGSNAINGVISVITKSSEDEKLKASGRVNYGSYNTIYLNSAISKSTDEFQFNVFTDVLTSSGEEMKYNDEQGNELSFNKKYQGLSLVSNFKYKNLTLHFQYYNRAEPAVRTREFQRYFNSATDTIGHFTPETGDENMAVGNIAYMYKPTKNTELRFRSNVLSWNLRKTFIDGHWDYSSLASYSDIELSFKLGSKSTNIVGVAYNNYIGRRYKSQINSYDIGKENQRTNELSTYLNGSYSFSKKIKFFYGGRYFYSSYSQVSLDNFSPRLAITYNPIRNLYIKAIYGNSFRVPTYFEKEVSSNKVIGNPDLLPEESTSFDLVISNTYKWLYFEVNGFYYVIKDQIRRVESPNDPEKRTNANTGNSYYYGIDLNSKFTINNIIQGFANYSYTKAYNKEDDIALKHVYSDITTLGLEVSPLKRIKINLSAKYLNDWGEAPPYLLANIGLNIKPNLNTPLFINIKVDNIFDTEVYLPEIARDNPLVPTIPSTMNRKVYLGISYRF